MPDEIKNVDSILFEEVELHTDCTVQVLKNLMTGEISIGWEEVELHTDCTVQVLKNLMTGEISIGWWDNNNPPATFGC